MTDITNIINLGQPFITDLNEAAKHYPLIGGDKPIKNQKFTMELLKIAVARCNITCATNLMPKAAEYRLLDHEGKDVTQKIFGTCHAQDVLQGLAYAVEHRIVHECSCTPSLRRIIEGMAYLGHINRYHPTAELFKKCHEYWRKAGMPNAWHHLEKTLRPHADAVHPEMNAVYLRKSMLQLCQAVCGNSDKDFHDPKQVGHMPVLIGEGGRGKTNYVKGLLPAGMVGIAKELRLEGSTTTRSDVVTNVTKTAITEIGELDATTKKTEVASLNNFLTDIRDEGRKVHRLFEFSWPRMTTFWATINEPQFIQSTHGSRRIWPMWVEQCSDEEHAPELCMKREEAAFVLGQTYEEWLCDESYFLDAVEAKKHAEQILEHLSIPWQAQRLAAMLEEGQKLDEEKAQTLTMHELMKEVDLDGWRSWQHDKKLISTFKEILATWGVRYHKKKRLADGRDKYRCYVMRLGTVATERIPMPEKVDATISGVVAGGKSFPATQKDEQKQ